MYALQIVPQLLYTDETKGDGSTPACNGLGSTDLGSTTNDCDPATSKSRAIDLTSNDTQLVSSDSLPPQNNTQQDLSVSQPPNSTSLQLHLCIVCGCSGPKRCGKCIQAHYCFKDHQTLDWRAGHKHFCEDLASGKSTLSDLNYNPGSGVALPEYEIVTELEPDLSCHGNGEQERSEEERMADYYKYIKSGKCGEGKEREMSAKALKDAATSEHKIDKQFRAFKKRVAIEPEQVRKEGRERERERDWKLFTDLDVLQM